MAEPNSISIDDTAPAQPQVSVDWPVPAKLQSLPADAVQDRSDIAALGLATSTGITKEQFKDAIANGQEEQIRQLASSRINQIKINMAKDAINTNPSMPSSQLQSMLKAQDPDSVFEEHYAKAYMNYLNWPTQNNSRDNWLWTTAYSFPQEWDYVKQTGEEHLAKYGYLQDTFQDTYGHSTWKDTAATIAKDIGTLGFYSEAKMRSNVAGTGTLGGGFFLGTNLDEQRRNLWALPFDQFKAEIKNAITNMPPDIGASWLKAMVGQSSSDQFINNASTGLNAFLVGQIAYAPLKSAATAATREVVARKAYDSMTTAVSGMLTPRPIGIPPEVAGPALAGNLQEAAVNRVTIDTLNEFNPANNPVAQLSNQMTGNYDVLQQGILNNPGNLSREASIRLADMVANDKERFLSTVLSKWLARGDRTPTAEIKEEIAKIQEFLANKYRGPDNQVLNVSQGEVVPGLNVRAYRVPVGTPEGGLFTTEAEALAVARRRGWAVLGDYDVSPEEYKQLKSIENLITGTKIQRALATTDEGRANTTKLIAELQKRLDDAPKHTTGVTIESQRLPAGTSPKAKTMAEATGLKSDKVTAEVTEPTYETYEQLKARLGREPTFQEEIAALEGKPLTRGGSPSIEERVEAKRQKASPRDIGEDEHLLQYRIRSAAQRSHENLRMQELASQGEPKPMIVQQGNGYYIQHVVYLPEEANFIRDGLIPDGQQIGKMTVQEYRDAYNLGKVSTGVPPDWAGGFVNAILGRIRSPAERLSIAENTNRIIATHGPGVLLGMLEDGSKPITAIANRKYWREFDRMIRYLQNEGIWFNTPAEVDEFYNRVNKRPPSELEQRAYFAYRTLNLDDLHMRNLSVMQHKIVMGAKQHAVVFTQKDGTQITTPFFEGIETENIPNRGRVLVLKGGDPDYNLAGRTDWSSIEPDLKEGKAKLIRMMDPTERPLQSIFDKTVDYVVTYNSKEKPLGFEHVNQQGGGHRIPKWDFFLKSADVDSTRILRRAGGVGEVPEGKGGIGKWLETPSTEPEYDEFHNYNGDKTMFSFRTRADAEEAQGPLENIRKMFVNHVKARSRIPTEEELARWEGEAGSIASKLPTDEMWYQMAADEAGKTGLPFNRLAEMWLGKNGAPPAFNVNEPIVVVPKGGKIIQTGEEAAALKARYPNLHDNTIEGSPLSKAMVAFTQERDAEGLYTLRSTGTESAPYFNYEPAPLVDPITALERGYSGIVNTMFSYDMKKFSIEHWLQQAAPYLKGTIDEIRSNPLKWFYNPDYQDAIPLQIKLNLESNRLMSAEFVGIGDKTTLGLRTIAQAASDAIQGKYKVTVKPLYDLPTETDYFRWARNVAFYASQISLKTFFTQASTLSNIFFIAGPRNAGKATAAMMQYGYWKMFSGKPEILEGIDRSLSKYFGWQPGRFTEAVNMMEGAGLDRIGNEHAFKAGSTTNSLQFDQDMTPFSLGWRTISNAGKTFLDYGSIPFNLGAGTTRISAFFTAYLEAIEKAPGGVIDRTLRDNMLSRASLLDVNMTTAFNSRLNKGILSIPFQFESYDQRMMEMMWGKQLTRNEKLALFTSSSIMFGLRGGFYATLGLPIANYVLGKTETAMGYVPGDNPLADLVVNGFPSWMFAMLSGFTDPNGKKTWIDFSKWGNRGIQPLEDFFSSDKTAADIALGAFGGVFMQAFDATWGIRKALWDRLTADRNSQYRVTSDDIFQVLKTQSLVSDINKTWLAFQTGKLFTRNDVYITDIGKVHAFIAGITGLGPIAASDVWIKQHQLSNNEQEIRKIQQHIGGEIQRAALDGANGDRSNHDAHMQNVNVLMKLIPPEKWGQTITEAFRGVGSSLEDRVNQKLYKDDLTMRERIGRSK